MDKLYRGSAFERKSVADFPNNALLQRVHEVHTTVAARDFRGLEVQCDKLPHTRECLTGGHNFGNHALFVRGWRRSQEPNAAHDAWIKG